MYLITSLYELTPPSKKEVSLRDKKIAACKEKMGDKWLLAKLIPRKNTK